MTPQNNINPDAVPMSGWDPNGRGVGYYDKPIKDHAATISSHLKSLNMTPQTPGAKEMVEGVHKAAMAQVFAPPVNVGSTTRGTSSGFMVGGK